MYRRHFRGLSEDLLPASERKKWALQESERLPRIEQALDYVTQPSPEGYGHAVYCTRDWVGEEPFLLLLGDHVYISSDPRGRRCARQVVDVFERTGQTVSAVKRTPERLLHLFGTVRGEPLGKEALLPPDGERMEDRSLLRPTGGGEEGLYGVTAMVEKPSPERAAQELRTPGLAPG